MIKQLTATIVATTMMCTAASATTFIFEGEDNNVDPTNAHIDDCASTNDNCSVDNEEGLIFELDGIVLQTRAYANGTITGDTGMRQDGDELGEFTTLIQDRNPIDSGLGAFSEIGVDNSADQTQFDAGESIEFIFEREFVITDVEFNAGGDTNCTNTAGGGGEGPCGEFLLQIFDMNDMLTLSTVIDVTNIDVLAVLGTGARFVLTALTEGGGFSIARLTVNEIPVPGAMLLLISGIAGLRFASRKKKTA